MYMRSGGEEIEQVQAEAPGTIDFIPIGPGRRSATLQEMASRFSTALTIRFSR